MITPRFLSTTGYEWARGSVLGLVDPECTLCAGQGGVAKAETDEIRVCHCVLRGAFRDCIECYHRIRDAQLSSNTTTVLDRSRDNRTWEDYLADFEGVAKRNLSERDYPMFRMYVIERREVEDCARRLRLTQEIAETSIYKFEVTLGRVYHELKPYAVHPPANYFTPGSPVQR